jgi:hypothetical protein
LDASTITPALFFASWPDERQSPLQTKRPKSLDGWRSRYPSKAEEKIRLRFAIAAARRRSRIRAGGAIEIRLIGRLHERTLS